MIDAPFRHRMMPDDWYLRIDAGIRFAVRVLHAAGLETCQSCEGGTGHAYPEPTVDLIAGPSDAIGFAALAALSDYGLDVSTVALVWNVKRALPYEHIWRVTLHRAWPERAEDRPSFVHGYVAQEGP